MYEHLASMFGGSPTDEHERLYQTWSKHDWGIIITGNVQVSPSHLSLGRDMVASPDVNAFSRLASVIKQNEGTLGIMQLCHAGRQSSNFIGGRWPFVPPLAPSAIPLGRKTDSFLTKIFQSLLFTKPMEMTPDHIDQVADQFVKGAQLARASGFDGVQLHAAHGCTFSYVSPELLTRCCADRLIDLLSQFMSEKVQLMVLKLHIQSLTTVIHKVNRRTDEYSVSNPLRLIHRIVTSIREILPPDFVVGIKLNAGDYVDSTRDGLQGNEAVAADKQRQHALDHVRQLVSWGTIDFIEISGGDYENPGMSRFLSVCTLE
jgi:2,4-dienoyl-CoA reductase-like NADH-dependent reductase (Old Yellow Enzyme family)